MIFPYGWVPHPNKPSKLTWGPASPPTNYHYGSGILKDKKCPTCGGEVTYMGVVPASVECTNPNCRWYKPPENDDEEKKNKFGYYD